MSAEKGTGTNPTYPDLNISYYNFIQSSICFRLVGHLTTAPTTLGASTLIYLLKNATVTPFKIGYGSNESGTKTYYASTFTFAPEDHLTMYISSTVAYGSNNTHDLTLQVELY
jgi:hypothetical protein